MPAVLRGNKSFSSVNDKKGVVYAYLKSSVVAWAGFGSTNVGYKKVAK